MKAGKNSRHDEHEEGHRHGRNDSIDRRECRFFLFHFHSRPESKVSLGFVEGLNNKIRVIQRRAYGLRDEEYLRLKILTCMLNEI